MMLKLVTTVSVCLSVVSAATLFFKPHTEQKVKNVVDIFLTKYHQKALLKVQNVVCPDQQSQCPDGSTCCKLSTGQYGCCPLPKAVCCSDMIHCCPSGTTCAVSSGKCNRQDGSSVLWSKKVAAKSLSVENVVCPDQQSQCPDGSTCCKLSTGRYGCCPLPKAVCCSDMLHCCPSGTTCDTPQGKCNRQDGSSVLWSKKVVAKSLSVEKVNNPPMKVYDVMCPDGHSQCSDGQTCCMLASGQYGCCPLPDFQCCGSKCCPDGYLCSKSGLCKKLRNSEWKLLKNGF